MQIRVRVAFFVLLVAALLTLFQAMSVLAESIPPQGTSVAALSLNGEKEYIIGPEDVLKIDVWQQPELSKTVAVRFDGYITYDLVGTIKAAGITPSRLKIDIAEQLKKYIRDPQVTVSVVEFNSRKVTVLGEVGQPGTFSLSGQMRLLEILTKSGWNRETADLTNITIMRDSGEVLRVDMRALLYKGDLSQNILLMPGDTIFVPEKLATAENRTQVLVMGEVQMPGTKNFEEGKAVTLMDVLLASDGVTKEAALNKAKIIRANQTEEQINLNRLLFQADMTANLPLYPGDTLYIPKTTLIRFYVFGMVGNVSSGSGGDNQGGAGVYQSQPEHATVLTAIAMAGQPRFGAVLSETKIVRGWPNDPVVMECNLEDLLYRGDISQNIQLEEGDIIYVPESFLSNVLDVVARILGPLSGAINTADEWEDVSN